jgi:uncharacterized damage-inducible protein DinB
MICVDHFKRMLAYDAEATRRVADSLRSVPVARQSDPLFAKARGVFAHIQQARHIWLSRLGHVPAREFVMWPDWSIDQTLQDAQTLDRAWESYLATLDDEAMLKEVRYTSTEGKAYASRIEEILTHVFNHATYHRGQIAGLVTLCHGTRAVTDFVAITRRSV